MARSESRLTDKIDAALQQITELFLHQCTHGAQTTSLPQGFAACGQFVGPGAELIQQLGLHGIAAALRVLGPCQPAKSGTVVQRLVSYCEACFGIHPTLPKRPDLDNRNDSNNVIKLGELLYALSFVTTAQAERERLVKHVSSELKNALRQEKGWGFYLGDAEPQLLPTAYAIRGLAQSGYDLQGPRKFVLEGIAAGRHTSPADLTTVIACNYCLTFCGFNGAQVPELRAALLSAWRPLEPLLSEDIEQNLEYWRDANTHYVRIPWQLYLLALAAEHSPWRFASFRAQRRMHAVIAAVKSNSFRYPYSGRYLSSRTNSIAFEVLSTIRDRLRRFVLLRAAYLIDCLRVWTGSRLVRLTVGALAVLLVLYSLAEWWLAAGKFSELAPNFVCGAVMFMFAWARR